MNLLGPMPSVEEFTGTLSALGAAILFNWSNG